MATTEERNAVLMLRQELGASGWLVHAWDGNPDTGCGAKRSASVLSSASRRGADSEVAPGSHAQEKGAIGTAGLLTEEARQAVTDRVMPERGL
jgi:hypothetical protein